MPLAHYIAMLFSSNQAAKGVAIAQQYAAANPKRVQAIYIYASALASTKKYDQALTEYQKAHAARSQVARGLCAYRSDL